MRDDERRRRAAKGRQKSQQEERAVCVNCADAKNKLVQCAKRFAWRRIAELHCNREHTFVVERDKGWLFFLPTVRECLEVCLTDVTGLSNNSVYSIPYITYIC